MNRVLEVDREADSASAIERCLPLHVASKRLGISQRTLMKWMEAALGVEFPVVGKGSRHLVKVADVEATLAKRMPAKVW